MTYALIGFFSAAWFGQDTQGNILEVSSTSHAVQCPFNCVRICGDDALHSEMRVAGACQNQIKLIQTPSAETTVGSNNEPAMLLLQNDLGKKEVQAFLNISISGGRLDPNPLISRAPALRESITVDAVLTGRYI